MKKYLLFTKSHLFKAIGIFSLITFFSVTFQSCRSKISNSAHPTAITFVFNGKPTESDLNSLKKYFSENIGTELKEFDQEISSKSKNADGSTQNTAVGLIDFCKETQLLVICRPTE